MVVLLLVLLLFQGSVESVMVSLYFVTGLVAEF
jgi:hypothetical protein